MAKYRWGDAADLRGDGFEAMEPDAAAHLSGSYSLDLMPIKDGEVLIEQEPAPVRPVDPLLFRTFAELRNKEDMLSFAGRHGLLTGIWWRKPGAVIKVEPFGLWQDEIHAIRAALKMWDASFTEDANEALALQQQFRPDAHGTIVVDRPKVARISNRGKFLLPEDHPRRVPFEKSDFRLAAQIIASRIADRYLEGRLNAFIEWLYDGESNTARRREAPRNLAGALWLQLQQAIVDGTSYARCTQCGNWMEITREARAKTTKLYCSDACRAKAYRERRAGESTKNKPKRRTKK